MDEHASTGYEDVAELFKAIGVPSRLAILAALTRGELFVDQLATMTGLDQPVVSHQLRVLRQAGLVNRVRRGRYAFYAVGSPHVVRLVHGALAAVGEERAAR